MAREIWIVRGAGWALILAAAWAVAASALRSSGAVPDVVPYALVAGIGFDAAGRALARLARRLADDAPASVGRGPEW